MNSMGTESHLGGAALRVPTTRPRLRWRVVAMFAAVILILGTASFYNHGARRAYYVALSSGAALALAVQYSRERASVSNSLAAEAVVTDWGRPVRSRSRLLDAILSRVTGNIPLIKYSFVAFDQKTYTGQTGWGARDLYIGAHIPVLYDAGNPARNHPLNGFVFYSFRETLMGSNIARPFQPKRKQI